MRHLPLINELNHAADALESTAAEFRSIANMLDGPCRMDEQVTRFTKAQYEHYRRVRFDLITRRFLRLILKDNAEE